MCPSEQSAACRTRPAEHRQRTVWLGHHTGAVPAASIRRSSNVLELVFPNVSKLTCHILSNNEAG